MRLGASIAARSRTVVAVAALYAFLLGVFLPGFSPPGPLAAAFQALCADGHRGRSDPAKSDPPHAQCCLAACLAGTSLAAPAADDFAVPARALTLVLWAGIGSSEFIGQPREAPRARGPPLV